MSQFGLAKNGLKILGTKCCSLDGSKIGWEQLSHCDSWSKILGYKCSFFGWTNSLSTLGFGLGPTVTRTKQTADQLLLGLTVWVELSLGLNVGGLNVKAPWSAIPLPLFFPQCAGSAATSPLVRYRYFFHRRYEYMSDMQWWASYF
jgi:hypothetical protein